jgi:hypothetical protein
MAMRAFLREAPRRFSRVIQVGLVALLPGTNGGPTVTQATVAKLEGDVVNRVKGLIRLAVIGAATLMMTTLGMSPAHAGDPQTRQCMGYGGQATGVTSRYEGLTYTLGGGCGTRMGVRVYYHSIGGNNWTSWKYVDPRYTARVLRSVYPNNAIYSEHFAGGTGTFISQFN